MRGGRFQQKTTEDANIRNSEALFESRTVAEIREVESHTRKEIEEKKEELRQLVGASYRDLIESADSIVSMKNSCENVAVNIQKMEEGFKFLKKSITVQPTASKIGQEKKRREKLYGIGGRVKYIVDTPEKIWGCLDEHMYLEGAQRYFRAREVHTLLTEKEVQGEKREFLAHFPLLRHQWPLVETFREQISQRSRDRLLEPELDVHQYAVALAAVAVIDEFIPSQALSLFLETRRAWLRIHLRSVIAGRGRARKDVTSGNTGKKPEKLREIEDATSATAKEDQYQVTSNGGRVEHERKIQNLEKKVVDPKQDKEGDSMATSATTSIATLFSKLANMMQLSLCQVGELFLEVNGDSPLFFSTVLNSPPGSQLFGGIPNPEEEVQLWKLHREKLESAMVPLAGEFISQSCLSWIGICEEDLISEGKVLLDLVEWGKELAEIEALVRKALRSHDAFEGSMDWLKSAFGQRIDSPWQCVSALVLREPLDLWHTLFERIFVMRAKGIIDSGLSEISISEAVDDFLTRIGPSCSLLPENGNIGLQVIGTPQTMGLGFSNSRWFPVTQSDSRLVEGPEILPVALWKLQNGAYLGNEVVQIKEEIDEKLRLLLEDLTSFLQSQQSPSRSKDLTAYLQEECFLRMSAIVEELQARLIKLFDGSSEVAGSSGRPGNVFKNLSDNLVKGDSNRKWVDLAEADALDISSSVEKALFLGRLCMALAYHSSSLQAALGLSYTWKLDEKSVTGQSLKVLPSLSHAHSLVNADRAVLESHSRWLSKTKIGMAVEVKDGGNTKFSNLQSALRCSSFLAHGIWVSWSTNELTRLLARDVERDDSLFSSIPLKGWEETVIKQQTEDGNEIEMKLPLPAMPSSYVVSFLFRSCQKLYRIGGHVLDKTILHLFAWRLLEKVLTVYENFWSDAKSGKHSVSEKGLLQLLFDLQFLGDVLSGGQHFTSESLGFLKDNANDSLVPTSLAVKLKESLFQTDATVEARKKRLTSFLEKLSSRLDPIDWATYEPHIWENERQSYQRCAVLFGFLVQLNRLYTNTVQKLSSNTDSNTLKVSATVSRFTYLPISTPSMIKKASSNEEIGGGSWKTYPSNANMSSFRFENDSSFVSAVGARPLFKSIMSQVGSRFGEGTFKLGSMLTDGQVSRLKDRSAAAISTFGEILPVQAAGLFSSLTTVSGKLEA